MPGKLFAESKRLLTLSENLAKGGFEPLTWDRYARILPLSYPDIFSESLAKGGFEPLTWDRYARILPLSYPDILSESLAEGGFEPLTIR